MFVDFLLLLIAILSVMLLGAYAIWESRDAEYYRQEMYRLRRELGSERMRR